MMDVYRDSRVEVRFEKHVISLDIQNANVKALNYMDAEGSHKVYADLFCVGANPIFNSHILLQSDIKHPLLGKGLCDHRGIECIVDLDNFDQIAGSTNVTGIGYMLATDAMRKEYAGAIIESVTVRDQIRIEKNKYLQRAKFVFDFDDLPLMQNYVTVSDDPKIPKVVYRGHSDYTQKGIEKLRNNVEEIFSGLPVEKIMFGNLSSGGRHIYGGVIMGSSEKESIVDKQLRHHNIKNLVVAGSSAFPSMGLVNPALTISALSLYAADTLF
jgi:choline dehydrogenase-like flavoprotein